MSSALRRYEVLVEPSSRRRWVGLVLLAMFVSVVESLTALGVFFLLNVLTSDAEGIPVPLLGDLAVRYPDVSEDTLFAWVAVFLGVFFVLRGLLVAYQSYTQHKVVNDTGAELSTRLLGSYLSRPFAWHLQRNSSELLRTAHESVIAVVANVLVPIVVVFSEALIVVGITIVMLVKAPLATLFAAIVLIPVFALVMRSVRPRMVANGQLYEDMTQQSLSLLQESLGGVRDITVLGREQWFVDRLESSARRQARALRMRNMLIELPRTMVETMAMLFVLCFVVATRNDSGDTLAVLGLFAYAVLRLLPSLNRIAMHLNLIKFGSAAVDNIRAELDGAEPDTLKSRPAAVEPLDLGDELVVDGVSFRYEGAASDAVRDITLRIPAGSSVGIVGATGGGKTTLIDLILGLLEPSSGRVTVDGVDIAGRIDSWYRNLGVVPQAPFLLDETLRRNIALGEDDAGIDEQAVAEAVALAQLDEFVGSLPDGLDTEVGERGVRISGGQRQRIAIARALYRRPGVVVFDEGTSALDNVTEADLVAALERLRGDHTVITVAHRISTVRGCDQIVLLEAGRVSDIGSYDELVERSAGFRQLVGS